MFISILNSDYLWAQPFTSLMADLHQDINRVFLHLAGALMEHFLEGIAWLRYWYINPKLEE